MHHSSRSRSSRPSGAAILLVLAVVLVLAVAGIALVRIAGSDRVDAAKLGVKDRGLACAEAGLQYARRLFGSSYDTSGGWNDYLSATAGTSKYGYRYDPALDGAPPTDFSSLPKQVKGAFDGVNYDPGAVDGSGNPIFWVSVRDDDDERPLGIANDPTRDNNETIIIRSQCINAAWSVTEAGQQVPVVLEGVLTHVQGSSGYGTAAKDSNSTDLVGNR